MQLVHTYSIHVDTFVEHQGEPEKGYLLYKQTMSYSFCHLPPNFTFHEAIVSVHRLELKPQHCALQKGRLYLGFPNHSSLKHR